MRIRKWAWSVPVVLAIAGSSVRAELGRPTGGSRIDSDPEVVYVEEFSEESIELLAIKAGGVYATKKGQRKLGNLKVDSRVKLVGFTEKAYKVRGEATHSGISGWVSPKVLASKDKDFVENLQRVYKRQMEVRGLIADGDVAIGMNLGEVAASLGEPTKTKVRQTARGQSGQWEFIVYEEQKHYQLVRDPVTGALYNQYTHTTLEETSKLVVEFENDVVTAIEESENKGGGRVRVVAPPIIFAW